VTRLDPTDPDAFARWLTALRDAVADLQGVAVDMLLPHRARRLGHAEHARLTDEACGQLDDLLTYASPEWTPPSTTSSPPRTSDDV
jgi:hypothetical protein